MLLLSCQTRSHYPRLLLTARCYRGPVPAVAILTPPFVPHHALPILLEAKEVCQHIHLVQAPVARGKADLNSYRKAGSEVVSVPARTGRCERASIDEVYLDLIDAAETMLAETPLESLEVIDDEALKPHILGLKHEDGSDMKENVKEWLCRSDADHRDKLLACGVVIIADLRVQVLQESQFTCSEGIPHNKMLSKLASAMNKPAQQIVVPCLSVQGLLESLPIKKIIVVAAPSFSGSSKIYV